MNFIPDKQNFDVLEVPYFEDASDNKVGGYDLRKKEDYYKNRVAECFVRLGASGIVFVPGKFPTSPERYGYRIQFEFFGMPGRIDAAALPIKRETPIKKDKALKQCLFLVVQWLEGEHASLMYRPGAIPLMPYLIGTGNKTIVEQMVSSGYLPDVSGFYLPAVIT